MVLHNRGRVRKPLNMPAQGTNDNITSRNAARQRNCNMTPRLATPMFAAAGLQKKRSTCNANAARQDFCCSVVAVRNVKCHSATCHGARFREIRHESVLAASAQCGEQKAFNCFGEGCLHIRQRSAGAACIHLRSVACEAGAVPESQNMEKERHCCKDEGTSRVPRGSVSGQTKHLRLFLRQLRMLGRRVLEFASIPQFCSKTVPFCAQSAVQ